MIAASTLVILFLLLIDKGRITRVLVVVSQSHWNLTNVVIGFINFDNVVRGCFQSCTLGYALDLEHQGRGYMNEALQIGIEHVFSKYNLH